MKIKQLLDKKGSNAVTVTIGTSVATAIRTMYQHHVGSVVVTETQNKPLGILTERDVMRLYAQGQSDFENLPIEHCMTTEVVIGHLDDDVDTVLAMMTERRFRHLPILHEDTLVGVISIGDLVKAKLEETSYEARALRDYIHT